jgi:short-subunit dehydrogenase
MGVYNVSKHAVVALSETLYQDLLLVTDRVSASVLCPYFVPTGIDKSERNRPDKGTPLSKSQALKKDNTAAAVSKGKVSAADIARNVFEATEKNQFYVFSHPHALGSVQQRVDAIVGHTQPPDPYAAKPELGEKLRETYRAAYR